MVNLDQKIEKVINFLEKHKEDRAVMAHLKRGLSEATQSRAWPHMARAGCRLENPRERGIYAVVMGTYAKHPCVIDKGNIGDTLRGVVDGKGSQEGLATFDQRFRRVLECDHAPEVCEFLPGVIHAAARTRNIQAVNYRQLFKDLWYWGELTKLQWAGAYWTTPNKKEEDI